MEYKFLSDIANTKEFYLPNSSKINQFILKSNNSEILKSIDFFSTEEKTLYIHGFTGTGKRQIINYILDFLESDVIKLQYYCKPSTVCDDILLSFIEIIENLPISKAVNVNTKIATLGVKLQQYVSSIKKPFVIVLNSFDDINEKNLKYVVDNIEKLVTNPNIKILISTRGMIQDVLGNTKIDRNVFIKGFPKEIFGEFVSSYEITYSDRQLEEFYKCTRGYYYYTALSMKIIQAMKLSLSEFVEKFKLSGMNFDTFLGATYVTFIPTSIRNFFWFLRTVRHGLTLNALAEFELYDDFSIEYLKSNLMIFQVGETIYVQDYFQQDIDISIPLKVEIKLHKYVVSIYEKQLKESLQTRVINMSRQGMRAEIDFHNNCIAALQNKPQETEKAGTVEKPVQKKEEVKDVPKQIGTRIQEAARYAEKGDNTKAIEEYLKIMEDETIDARTLNDVRHQLGILYKAIGSYSDSEHYYELVEYFYKRNKELINLNYIYYEMADLYKRMYKNKRAAETIKKVIYSVDTPQSLMVEACTTLGNIYYELKQSEDAYQYYQKALDSLEKDTPKSTLAELYFKFALSNDERNDEKTAFEYYEKCISIPGENPYKALAYSNMGSCYYDNYNYNDAIDCFTKAYQIEKSSNNFDGIFYTAYNIAQILGEVGDKEQIKYLLEAKQSAEYLNEDDYIMKASLALGDYYYNIVNMGEKALEEYLIAKQAAQNLPGDFEIEKIDRRIEDMKIRMKKENQDLSEKENKENE